MLASFPFSNGLGMSLPLSHVMNLVSVVMDKSDSSTPNEEC